MSEGQPVDLDSYLDLSLLAARYPFNNVLVHQLRIFKLHEMSNLIQNPDLKPRASALRFFSQFDANASIFFAMQIKCWLLQGLKTFCLYGVVRVCFFTVAQRGAIVPKGCFEMAGTGDTFFEIIEVIF